MYDGTFSVRKAGVGLRCDRGRNLAGVPVYVCGEDMMNEGERRRYIGGRRRKKGCSLLHFIVVVFSIIIITPSSILLSICR